MLLYGQFLFTELFLLVLHLLLRLREVALHPHEIAAEGSQRLLIGQQLLLGLNLLRSDGLSALRKSSLEVHIEWLESLLGLRAHKGSH